MLEIINLKKVYASNRKEFIALENINLYIAGSGLVAILGPSGCGKSTLLNIIGGIIKQTSGELIINHENTKLFNSDDWDYYRNHCFSYIFQNYQLIDHLNAYENIELALSLCKVSKKEAKKRILAILDKVDMLEHAYKKTIYLSGGQRQRIAIARALVTNPQIILADEPTGALDSKNSRQIMQILKEVSKTHLVIMVTHNKELANEFATRIIQIKNKTIQEDIGNTCEKVESKYISTNKTLSLKDALRLSYRSLLTKAKRTALSVLASSIGIIGITIALFINNGFKDETMRVNGNITYAKPIILPKVSINNELEEYHLNRFYQNEVNNFLDTVIQENEVYFQYHYYLPLLSSNNETMISARQTSISTSILPNENILKNNYQLLYKLDKEQILVEEKYQLYIMVDEANTIHNDYLNFLGLEEVNKISVEDMVGKVLYLPHNDDYYYAFEHTLNYYKDQETLKSIKDRPLTKQVQIVGIYHKKNPRLIAPVSQSIAASKELYLELENEAKHSHVALYQQYNGYEVSLHDNKMVNSHYLEQMSSLGAGLLIYEAYIYASTEQNYKAIINWLDNYNEGVEAINQIHYLDHTIQALDEFKVIIYTAQVILVTFAMISLLVSSTLISIIAYISIIEREKEINIIRSIGGRKKDIMRIFNTQTCIVGFLSGIMGYLGAVFLSNPLNNIVNQNNDQIYNIIQVQHINGIFVILLSTILSFVFGYIPAKIASKKQIVEHI